MKPKKPIYQTIAEAIKLRISDGTYKPGQRIPPIRQLTRDFGVNKATVQKAFECLKRENLIENRVGSGSYVRFPSTIRPTGEFLSFKSDYLAESFFPASIARQIFCDLFESEKAHALAGAPVQGDPDLLRLLSRRYRLPAERMLIVSGAQQGLDLVSKVFAANISEAMLFEDPTYPGALSLFRPRHFVPMEGDGPRLENLDQQLGESVRLFYTMPSIHNPTGISYSLSKKQAVARRADAHQFYIVEDDYQGEIESDGSRFIDLAPERTIHIKSFSQTLLEGIRLGFMVVPANLHEAFLHAKYASDIASSGLMQKFLLMFIRNGHYDAHLHTIKSTIETRRNRIRAILDRFAFLTVPEAQSGYSLWVNSGAPVAKGPLPWCRGEEFSFSPHIRSYFRLSFMHLDEGGFERALPYLERLLSEQAAN